MTNQQILAKAIKKAIANGWIWAYGKRPIDNYADLVGIRWLNTTQEAYKLFIFNHDFAKALWGSEKTRNLQILSEYPIPEWKYQLACMAMANDPIVYLGEHLPD